MKYILFAKLLAVTEITIRKYNARGCGGGYAECANIPRDTYCMQPYSSSDPRLVDGGISVTDLSSATPELAVPFRSSRQGSNTYVGYCTQAYENGISRGNINCFSARYLGTGQWYDCASPDTASEAQTCNAETKRSLSDQPNVAGRCVSPSGYFTQNGTQITLAQFLHLGEGFVDGEPTVDSAPVRLARRAAVGSISIYVDAHCRGERLLTMSQDQVCYTTENGTSADVQALPSTCRVVVFDDTACAENAFTLVARGRNTNGCFSSGDGFNSAKLICD